MFFHAIDERTATNVEVAGSLGLIAAEPFESAEKQFALHRLKSDSLFRQFEQQSNAFLRKRHPAKFRGQVGFGYEFPIGKAQHPLDDVFQFTDVPGPAVSREVTDQRGCEADVRHVVAFARLVEEVFGELGNVLAALAEGWELQGNNSEPIKEVLPKSTVFDHCREVAVRGGDGASDAAQQRTV